MRKSACISGFILLWLVAYPFVVSAQEIKPEPPQKEIPKPAPKTDLPEKPLPFGYNIFRAAAEQVVEGPVDEDYLVSAGDEIIVRVWGQLNLNYPLTVSDDGFITIPDEGGRVYTNGLNLKELKVLVAESLSRIYSNYINLANPAQSTAYVDVKLGKVRKLLVYVVGEVQNQGAFNISAGVASLLNLLNNAGGIKESGSLRDIKIRRTDGSVDTVDLYEFLISGKLDIKKIRIRYGDYILVPLKGKSASIKGEVKRSGAYEVIGNEGVKDLVRFAGGLTSNAYLKRTQVRRFDINAGEKIIDIDGDKALNDPAANFVLQDGDEVTIFPNVMVRRLLVEIAGNGIKRPGIYEFRPGMTLKDLVAAAEGLKEYVYLDRADLVRTEEDFSKRITSFSLKELFREDKPGNYVYTGKEEMNFKLREMDQVTLYSIFQMRGGDKTVVFEGHVKEPGTYVLAENMTLYDLIFARGGFEDVNYKNATYLDLGHIFRKKPGEINEKLMTFNLGGLLAGNPKDNIPLANEDRIHVYDYETMKAKPSVMIEGLVKRPGSYPIAESLTLEDLLMLAGGLTPDAYKVEALIARTARKEGEESLQSSNFVIPVPDDFALIPIGKRTPLEAFDKVVIRHVPGWEPQELVYIAGEIVYPGTYTVLSKEERISSLIKRAGGLKKEALAEGALLQRRKTIVGLSRGEAGGYESVAFDLTEALARPGREADVLLKDGDRISIPTNPGVVEVRGAVRKPGVLQYRGSASLEDYVRLCGGYIRSADKNNAIVFLPNQTAKKRSRFLFFRLNMDVPPGSIINIPEKEQESGAGNTVEVKGAVKFPLEVKYRAGRKLDYYLEVCGGFRDDADPGLIVVRLPDGTVLDSKGVAPFNPVIPAGSSVQVAFKEIKSEDVKK